MREKDRKNECGKKIQIECRDRREEHDLFGEKKIINKNKNNTSHWKEVLMGKGY